MLNRNRYHRSYFISDYYVPLAESNVYLYLRGDSTYSVDTIAVDTITIDLDDYKEIVNDSLKVVI